ncbi:fructosamine kinase family protein [Streptomyces litchfieldiae]|uniref:Fructosamine kinase family protein n=1 Tax=Streptomyces litchfieldiae TaxID=3075543 RepID=A0ABU2MKS5_9ACTN|nr:fructosamine kinase family protein [Streptomyces sp. DSM 44938]MDT0342199.1 fructosamine kinase family protein [Streptomyces sp. DSM 44938]
MNETDLARRVGALTGAATTAAHPVSGGEICASYRVELADGRTVFAKTLADAPADFFAAEAAGLELLRGTGAIAIPRVLAVVPDLLVLEWVEPTGPTPAQAERLGRELAALHSTPAPHYGTAGPLYLGPVPLATPAPPVSEPAGWAAFHAEYRLLPLLRLAVDNGGIGAADARDVELLCARIDEVAGPPQPPAVIHGDLWAGNILWTAGGTPHLIDPAAQGGHPEADLAFLEISGCPHFDRVIAAYEESRPLPGRTDRAPLHLLHHILIHAALFGGDYGKESGDAARAALRTPAP